MDVKETGILTGNLDAEVAENGSTKLLIIYFRFYFITSIAHFLQVNILQVADSLVY